MLPTPELPPIADAPTGSPLSRAIQAIREGRLPYQVAKALDTTAVAVGLREKTISADGMRLRVRRGTMDEAFVAKVAAGCEYGAIESGWNVVDVGGNIGTFSVRAARTAARVVTAEPSRANFRLLSRNLELNGAKNVTARNVAVAGKAGTVTLNCGDEGGLFSIIPGRGGERTETVEAITLETLMQGMDRCDFLKVDCEGAEHEIFHSLPAQVFARIDRIAMEWHGPADRDERIKMGCALVDVFQDHGFRIDLFTEFVGFRSGMIRASKCR